jgi:hypothetical protein
MIFSINAQKNVHISDQMLTLLVELECLILCVKNAAEQIQKTPNLGLASCHLKKMTYKIRDLTRLGKNFQPS